jgi:hypothetical protein
VSKNYSQHVSSLNKPKTGTTTTSPEKGQGQVSSDLSRKRDQLKQEKQAQSYQTEAA